MSWINPTPEEAEQAYYNNRNRYNAAASQKRTSEQQEIAYSNQRTMAKNQLSNAKSDKVNFEKRLEGVKKIVAMLEGSGGWGSTNVPNTISKANRAVSTAGNSYRKCIKETGGTSAASLADAFETKSVEGERHSSSALLALKKEASRLEQAIADVKKQISGLNSTIDNLNRQIRTCNSTQASLQRTMNSCAFEMVHYSRYM